VTGASFQEMGYVLYGHGNMAARVCVRVC